MQQQTTLPQLAHQFQRFAGEVQQATESLGGNLLALKKRLYELEAVMALQGEGRKQRRRPEFRSQHGEDCVIWDLLDRQTGGFYIEVGAFDGRSFSVTYALDAMGWNGLLIEAIPQRAAECKANRPDARVVHAALGAEHGGTVKFHVTGDAWGGMLSYTDPHSDHGRAAAASGTTITAVDVPRTTLNELLKDHAGKAIDVAVIDVEGGEVELLKGFDLARFRPRVLLLEDNQMKQRTPLTAYMESQPYRSIGYIDNNRIYVHNDERAILERIGFKGP
jgi:FkbM family methyltransferase